VAENGPRDGGVIGLDALPGEGAVERHDSLMTSARWAASTRAKPASHAETHHAHTISRRPLGDGVDRTAQVLRRLVQLEGHHLLPASSGSETCLP